MSGKEFLVNAQIEGADARIRDFLTDPSNARWERPGEEERDPELEAIAERIAVVEDPNREFATRIWGELAVVLELEGVLLPLEVSSEMVNLLTNAFDAIAAEVEGAG
jgi:hypothetical protein